MVVLIRCNLQLKMRMTVMAEDWKRRTSKTRPILIWLSIILYFKQDIQIGGAQASPRAVGYQTEFGAVDLELLKSVHSDINSIQSYIKRGGSEALKKKERFEESFVEREV